jgi:hypothetical protein
MAFWRELYLRLRHQWRIHYLVPLLLFLPLIALVSRGPFDSVQGGDKTSHGNASGLLSVAA